MDKVAYYEELIMEKVALNAARKKMMSGELENMVYTDPKTGIKETALYTIMNRDGVVPSDSMDRGNLHNKINAKAKRFADNNIPKNVGTVKGYKKLERPNNLRKSDVLGHFRATRFLGHQNEEVVRKLKNLGIGVLKTDRGDGRTRLFKGISLYGKTLGEFTQEFDKNKSPKGAKGYALKQGIRYSSPNPEKHFIRFTVPKSNSPSAVVDEFPDASAAIAMYYPQAHNILRKGGRALVSGHEISGEGKERGRMHKLTKRVLKSAPVGTHDNANVLANDAKTLKTIGNPYLSTANYSLRSSEPVALWTDRSQKDLMNFMESSTKKPLHQITHKDLNDVNSIFAQGRVSSKGTRMSRALAKTPFWDAKDKLKYNRKDYND